MGLTPLQQEVFEGYSRGWRYTPLAGKRPTLREWASLEPADCQQCLAWAKAGNVGLRTGLVSGVVVVDLEPEGAYQLDRFPATPTVRTGRDGYHLYYRPSGPVGNRCKTLLDETGERIPAADLRGDGGQVVAVACIHPDTGRPYQWLEGRHPNDLPFAPLPGYLAIEPKKLRPAAKVDLPPAYQHASEDRRSKRWLESAMDRSVQRVASAGEGQRNDTLNAVTYSLGRLVAGGHLAREAVAHAMIAAAQTCGLSEIEAWQTINSAMRAAEREPINVLPVGQLVKRRRRVRVIEIEIF